MSQETSPPAPTDAAARRVILACVAVACGMMALFVVGGRLNDGGWYLYAAKLACTGHAPYRDFLYPQPPLTLYLYGPLQALSGGSLLLGRVTAVATSLAVVGLSLAFARRRSGPKAAAFVALCFAVNWYTLYFLTIVKTYPLAALFVLAGTWACVARRYGVAQALFVAATLTRLSAAPALLAVAALEVLDRKSWRAALLRLCAAATTLGCVAGWLSYMSDGGLLQQLYLPLGKFIPGLTGYYVGGHEDYTLGRLLLKKVASLCRTVLICWLPLVGIAWGARHVPADARGRFPRDTMALLTIALPVAFGHLLARRPYEEYQTIIFPLLCLAAGQLVARRLEATGAAWRHVPRWRLALLAAPLLVAPMRGLDRLDWSGGKSASGELREAARVVEKHAPRGEWLLTLEPYLAVESSRNELPPALLMGRYAYHPEWSAERCRRLPVVNESELQRLLARSPRVVALAPNHFTTADPGKRRELEAQWDRFVRTVRRDYELVAEFGEFGYSRDTLSIYARNP